MNFAAVAPSIYIIGAQCTGKTTLLKAISNRLREGLPETRLAVIAELARGVLVSADVNRDDISSGSEKGMKFQRLVLQAQFEQELALHPARLIISDRSGIDPIAYARKYGSPDWAQEMLGSSTWATLRERMQHAVVVLCEPIPAWLSDDGIRLVPKDNTEWFELHKTFVELLQESRIVFYTLSAATIDIQERVDFVLDIWRKSQDEQRTRGTTGDEGLS